MYRCKLCSDPVFDSRGRRQLASPSSACCTAILVDLASEIGTAKNEATKEYTCGFLCKKCFNSIGKYAKQKDEVATMKMVFLSKLSPHTCERQGTKRKADTTQQGQVPNVVKVTLIDKAVYCFSDAFYFMYRLL